jgi:hypothetical protein
MSGLTREQKARGLEDYITKKVNQRYAAFAKYRPGAFEIRDFLRGKIRERILKGSNFPDGPLEDMMDKEIFRRSISKSEVTPTAITVVGQRRSHG